MNHPVIRRTQQQVQQPSLFAPLVDLVQGLQRGADAVSKSKGRTAGRIALRLSGATIKAVTKGQNAGAAYVFDHQNLYAGKITKGGAYAPIREDRDTGLLVAWEIAQKAMTEALADPMAAAVRFGRETGNCSCCGRRLDRKDSIERGIGPICAEKLGAAWG
jgi:hypothetical protein